MNRFISILQFLTRIPIRVDTGFDEEFYKSIVYFPLVGFVIGIITYVFGCASLIAFDPFISAVIITLVETIITGGLHIDGLGDTFDAIYSNRDRERMLEIMKDSRLGTNSLLAIMFLILLKVGFINSIIQNNLLYLVIFMPMVARIGAVIITYKTSTPRAQGMGNLFIGKGTMGMILTSVGYSALIIVGLAKIIFFQENIMILGALSSIIVIILFSLYFKSSVYKKIGGITGDILGCTIELGEVFFLIYTYMLLLLI